MTVLIVLGCIAVALSPLVFYIYHGTWRIRRLVIRGVDLSKVPDGVYEGQYHCARWTYDVSVTVKKHKITELKNTNARMEKLSPRSTRQLVDRIVAAQSTKIDVLTMGTITTRAFQAAVENALMPAAAQK